MPPRFAKTLLNPRLGLLLALLLGIVFRLLWLQDMEYKSDEQWMFERVIAFGRTEGWRWVGMPSGAGVVNPGMSVWSFIAIGRLFGAQDPVELCRGISILNSLAVLGVALMARFLVARAEREPWYWAAALVAINPLAVVYERKIWAQSILPLASVLFLAFWWVRHRRIGALGWGLIGACLGQVHMSGFFLAFGFVLWTWIYDRRSARWGAWLAGSCLGAWPLLFWVRELVRSEGLRRVWVPYFYPLWASDAWGVGLHYNLGDSVYDAVRWPLLAGHPTYLMGVAHAVLIIAGFWLLARLLVRVVRRKREGESWRSIFSGGSTSSGLAQQAGLWGFGGSITLAGIVVRRHYLIVAFPLEHLWFARSALVTEGLARGRRILLAVALCQAFVTATLLVYLHQSSGISGDYGKPYRITHPVPAAERR